MDSRELRITSGNIKDMACFTLWPAGCLGRTLEDSASMQEKFEVVWQIIQACNLKRK